MREMGEELSLKEQDFSIVREKGGYRYQFPHSHSRRGAYTGQVQTYFLCDFEADDSAININTPKPEFRSWKWIQPAEFNLNWLPEFKRAVYAEVLRDFFQVAT